MEKVRVHPLTIAALIISSVLMAMYAYRNFNADETAYGIVFILLCLFLLGLAAYGWIRNRRMSDGKTSRS